jgi:superfamily I DNA/RNA helicase
LLRDIFNKGIAPKFDKLIIDEGQDLIREEYLRLFDAMLKGSLVNGNWEIYGDFEQQSIFAQLSKAEMFELINHYSQPAKFYLKINCRNTKQIGEETSLISGFSKPPFLLEYLEGIPVEYSFYNSKKNQSDLLVMHINQLLEKGLSLHDLIIVSPRKYENSCVNIISVISIREIRHTNEIYPGQNYYSFATVQSFKGMECNYVILTDIEDLKSDNAKSLLYVGMSRARYGLIILIADSIKGQYREILKGKIK